MQENKGFSFLEMFITLSIIMILIALASPFYRDLMQKNHHDLLKSQLINAISFAYQEAHNRHVAISLCQSNQSMKCLTKASEKEADRLLVFIDEENEGHIKNKEMILLNQPMNWQHGQLYWRAYPHYRHFLHFKTTSLSENDNGTFWFCERGKQFPQWGFSVSRSGRIRERDLSLTCES